MIDDPNPSAWTDLQAGVCRLFNEIGLSALTEHSLATPRGQVTVDVHAIDERSVDKIKYIVECKNWDTAIPQTVVHAFTTVMHETGSNIGFIVSKQGLQRGAEQYTRNTNVIGVTYAQLQLRYLPVWWQTKFCIDLSRAADTLLQYVEPINSRRDRYVTKLSPAKRKQFLALYAKHFDFGMAVSLIGVRFGRYSSEPPTSVEEFKHKMAELLGKRYQLTSSTYRELLGELIAKINSVTAEFNAIFGENIFAAP
jgi:restriction system protein